MDIRSVLVGLFAASLAGGPAVATGLEHTLRWAVDHASGTNSVSHAAGRAYIASGLTLHALSLATGMPEGEVAIDPDRFGAITGVAAHAGLVAISVTDRAGKTESGWVLLYRVPGLQLQQELRVGAGPDMLAFSPFGSKLLVANEGEPECRLEGGHATLVDPEGSVTVIELAHGFAYRTRTIGFTEWNGRERELIDQGVRIFGPSATAAQDLEPEHIAIGPFGFRAWVTLQENNAVALLDLAADPPRVTRIVGLGDKDHGLGENALDANDADGLAERRTHPGLYGMYQPDGIAAGLVGGRVLLFTANEGDARDYPPCFSEEVRVRNLSLDPARFSAAERDLLRNLRVTTTRGQQGGVHQELYAFGGRSFSILDADGDRIFESGSVMEDWLAGSAYFYDSRSDDKGPEPEDVAFGRVGGRPFLFVGLERANGAMAFLINRNGTASVAAFPERLAFVPALGDQPALLLVTNEISGTTRAFELKLIP